MYACDIDDIYAQLSATRLGWMMARDAKIQILVQEYARGTESEAVLVTVPFKLYQKLFSIQPGNQNTVLY